VEICGFAAAGKFFIVEAALVGVAGLRLGFITVAGGLAAWVTGFAGVGAIGVLLVAVFGTFGLLYNFVRVQRRTLPKAGDSYSSSSPKRLPKAFMNPPTFWMIFVPSSIALIALSAPLRGAAVVLVAGACFGATVATFGGADLGAGVDFDGVGAGTAPLTECVAALLAGFKIAGGGVGASEAFFCASGATIGAGLGFGTAAAGAGTVVLLSAILTCS
jgi:hypothetical protein